jgi:pyruvate kinase
LKKRYNQHNDRQTKSEQKVADGPGGAQMMIKPVKKKNKFIKTKIVATIGPSSTDEKVLLRMVKAGMSVVRLNFSHGNYDLHREVIKKIRKIAQGEDIPVAILQDLSGPKIRLGQLPEPVELKKNQLIKLSIEQDPESHLYTDFKLLVDIVKKDETILVNDGYTDEMIRKGEELLRNKKLVKPGDLVITVSGKTPMKGATNMLKISKIT